MNGQEKSDVRNLRYEKNVIDKYHLLIRQLNIYIYIYIYIYNDNK